MGLNRLWQLAGAAAVVVSGITTALIMNGETKDVDLKINGIEDQAGYGVKVVAIYNEGVREVPQRRLSGGGGDMVQLEMTQRPEYVYAFPSFDKRFPAWKRIEDVDWDNGQIELDLPGPQIINVKVHFCHQYESIDKERARLKDAVDFAHGVLEKNNWPIVLKVVDHEGCSHATELGSSVLADDADTLEDICSRESEYLHVFVADSVKGSRKKGVVWKHPQPYLVMGSEYRTSLLLHELGHCFGLDHPSSVVGLCNGANMLFNLDNFMQEEEGSSRDKMALGQLVQSMRLRGSSLCRWKNIGGDAVDKDMYNSCAIPGFVAMNYGEAQESERRGVSMVDAFVFGDCFVDRDLLKAKARLAVKHDAEQRDRLLFLNDAISQGDTSHPFQGEEPSSLTEYMKAIQELIEET